MKPNECQSLPTVLFESLISFYGCPLLEMRDGCHMQNLILGTWGSEIYHEQLYLVCWDFIAGFVVLHNLCIKKTCISEAAKSVGLPFRVEPNCSRWAVAPTSFRRGQKGWAATSYSPPLSPIPSTQACCVLWQPVLFVSVERSKQSLPVHRTSPELTR